MSYVVDPLRWKGDISAVWDAGSAVGTGGTNNWILETAGTATNFIPQTACSSMTLLLALVR
ncbi:hypothetical protein EMGBS8_09910 [Verrucomicrobiota bacterium]|nr:hypothetical protein EMGBS8_09910 [Verrucomicrobiota bacterium]